MREAFGFPLHMSIVLPLLMGSFSHIYVCIYTHARTHIHTHTGMHAHIHTHARTYIHTHMHTRMHSQHNGHGLGQESLPEVPSTKLTDHRCGSALTAGE